MDIMTPMDNGICLNVTVISDTHIDVKHPRPALPVGRLADVLTDIREANDDALVIVGDTTSHGVDANWSLFRATVEKTGCPAKQFLIAIGNHDTWDDGDDSAIPRYLRYTAEVTGLKHEKPYFAEYVNGYPFLFLGSERDAGCAAYISEEQLLWFASEMETAAAVGKPVFVFCHQSLNQKHGLPVTWDADEDPNAAPWDGGVGDASDRIEQILKRYPNVFYFSGHSHMGLAGEGMKAARGYASIEREGSLTLVNLPSLACGNHHGERNDMGVGVQIEAYPDRVLLRVRRHSDRVWNTEVSVDGGKPFFEQLL